MTAEGPERALEGGKEGEEAVAGRDGLKIQVPRAPHGPLSGLELGTLDGGP